MGEGQGAAGEAAGGHQAVLAKEKEKTPPQWYVNGQGQTMVVIPGPVEFVMGSPPRRADRAGQRGAAQEADRSDVCPCSEPVTKEQFLRFNQR